MLVSKIFESLHCLLKYWISITFKGKRFDNQYKNKDAVAFIITWIILCYKLYTSVCKLLLSDEKL